MIKFFKNRSTSIKYLSSGLLKTGSQIIAGFIVFRWLEPEKIGQWQSIALFASYFNILTLGSISGLNRDLPYLMGKKKNSKAMVLLESVGYYINLLSKILMLFGFLIVFAISLIGNYPIENLLMVLVMILMGVMGIQSSFYAATYRSANSFNKLSKIQSINIFLNFIIIPLVFYFNIWGYIIANFSISFFILAGYYHNRPFKIKHKKNNKAFREVVNTGFVIYLYNYLFSLLKTIPRLVLVIFGSPLMVGLFAPAATINGAVTNLPIYINSYIFPKMNFKYGATNNSREIYDFSIRIIQYLAPIMVGFSITLAIIIPYVFKIFFPKYENGILTAQIFVFISIFYAINMVLHNGMYSIKEFSPFSKILLFKAISMGVLVLLIFKLSKNLLLSVAFASVISEGLSTIIYLLYFKNSVKEIPYE